MGIGQPETPRQTPLHCVLRHRGGGQRADAKRSTNQCPTLNHLNFRLPLLHNTFTFPTTTVSRSDWQDFLWTENQILGVFIAVLYRKQRFQKLQQRERPSILLSGRKELTSNPPRWSQNRCYFLWRGGRFTETMLTYSTRRFKGMRR